MHGYWINDFPTVCLVCIFLVCSPFIGFPITRIKSLFAARTIAWLFVFGSVVLTHWMTIEEPSGTRMLLIIVALLWAMKSVVAVENNFSKGIRLNFRQWICFVVFWFGMRPRIFEAFPGTPKADYRSYLRRGSIQCVLGIGIYFVVRFFWPANIQETNYWLQNLLTMCLLISLSLIVHFGFFNLLTGFWRSRGVNCTSLFRAPLYSTSLTEFWGRRWNLAFSEMTSLAIFRPLNSKFGFLVAMTTAFIFSGLLHELAISVPVMNGFGFPLLYFGIHAIGMMIEKLLAKLGINIIENKAIGFGWTMLWILVPLPILFHRPFLEGCVWPLIGK